MWFWLSTSSDCSSTFQGHFGPLSHKGLSQAHRWRAREEDFETYGGTFSKCQNKFTLKKNSKENKPLLTSQMLTNDSYSADWPGCLMNIDGNAWSKWHSCATTCPCQLSFRSFQRVAWSFWEIWFPTLLKTPHQSSCPLLTEALLSFPVRRDVRRWSPEESMQFKEFYFYPSSVFTFIFSMR